MSVGAIYPESTAVDCPKVRWIVVAGSIVVDYLLRLSDLVSLKVRRAASDF